MTMYFFVSNKWKQTGLVVSAFVVIVTIIVASMSVSDTMTVGKVSANAVSVIGKSDTRVDDEKLTLQSVMEKRFEARQVLVNETCHRSPYTDMKSRIKGRFTRLARGRIRLCKIPKVGSTYLIGLEKTFLRPSLDKEDNDSSEAKTLMFVREPYSRLVSGYIGKIVTNQPWWKMYGTPITKKFRPRATEKAIRCGNTVTFPEFLKYFIEAQENGWHRNIHFNPLHTVCNPCSITFDFIGHLETLKDDLSYVLDSVGAPANLDLTDEEITMRAKVRTIFQQKPRIIKCESMCSVLNKVWWSFQARGLIASDIAFTLPPEKCDVINGTEYADLAWDAHLQSMGRLDKSKQKREMMTKLFLQAPLADRMKVRDLLMKDFELFGYDPQPTYLFPELLSDMFV